MINEISYPIETIIEGVKNAFPSQKPLYFTLTRKDANIVSIVSGVDNNVRIETTEDLEDVEAGQFVTWKTDGYTLRTNKIVSVISAKIIEVDELFTGANVANNFLNYKINHFIEVRYVVPTSASDSQTAQTITDDFTRVPSARNGEIKINIGLPAELLAPAFLLDSAVNTGLSIPYKIQYRESYEGNRNNLWISPADDYPLLLIHASEDFTFNDFTDKNISKTFVRGYPLLYSFIYSDINDAGSNTLTVSLKEYALNKDFIQEGEVVSIDDANGVITLLVDTNALHVDTCFIEFAYSNATNRTQYEGTHYEVTQYA